MLSGIIHNFGDSGSEKSKCISGVGVRKTIFRRSNIRENDFFISIFQEIANIFQKSSKRPEGPWGLG